MRCLLFLITIGLPLFSSAQSFYGSFSGGYVFYSRIDQPPSYFVNSYHQVTSPWFWQLESFDFQDGFHADVTLGQMLTKNVGYELSGSYLKPLSVDNNSSVGDRILSGQFVQTAAKVVVSIPYKRFDFYAKVGINVAMGKMQFHQSFKHDGSSSLSFSEATLVYEYQHGVSLGFTGSLGMNFPVSKRFSVFSEITFNNQVYSPKSGKMIEFTADGVDQLAYLNEPYFSEIDFGEESEWQYYNSDDKTQPQKLYSRGFSLGGIGLTVGMRFVLWEKG
jgi:hypothetical protein